MCIIRDPQANQIDQAVFLFPHAAVSEVYGHRKDYIKNWQGPSSKAAHSASRSPSAKPRAVLRDQLWKAGGKASTVVFPLHGRVAEALKPQWQSQKNWARVSLPQTAMGVSLIVNRASEAGKKRI